MRHLQVLVFTALLLTPGTAAADWLSLRSDHFLVIGNTSGGQLRDVAVRLEQFREVVGQLNPAVLREESAPPVVVLVFRDARTYEPFMPRHNGEVVRAGGFFQSGQDVNYITLNVQAGQGAFHVVFHEYSHLLLRGVFADAPVWFNEGLAEYYSTFEVINSGRRANIGKAIARHVGLLRERRLPFSELFAIDRNSRAYTADVIEREILYAQAWAIVHHAFHGPPSRRDQLLAFVGKVANGGATESSFREAYGITVRELEREIQLYVDRQAYRFGSYELSDRVVTRINAESTNLRRGSRRLARRSAQRHGPSRRSRHTRKGRTGRKAGIRSRPRRPGNVAHAPGPDGRRPRPPLPRREIRTAERTSPVRVRERADRERQSRRRDDGTGSCALERAIELRPGYREARSSSPIRTWRRATTPRRETC